MGASMANITRIKANDNSASDKSKDTDDSEAAITRKVSVKAKNSSNKKVAKAKAESEKAAKKAKKSAEKAEKKVPAILLPLYWITAPFRALGRYIKNSFIEMRQVRWPDRKSSWKMTFSIIIYVVLIAGFIMLLDALFTFVFNKLLGAN